MIVQDGLRRMYAEQEDVYYYITVMNENYEHPAMPEGAEDGIIKGMYLFQAGEGQGRQGRGTARAAAGQRHDPARGDRGGRPAGEDWGVAVGHLERAQLHRAAPRGDRRRALEPAAPDRDAAPEPCRDVPGRPERAGGRRDRLHAAVRRPDPHLRAGALPGARAPTASAARTTAGSCATSSRSTGTGSTAGGARERWPRTARSEPQGGGEAITKYGHRSGEAEPEHGLTHRQTSRRNGEGPDDDCQEREAAPMARSQVKVPDIGDFKDVPVIEIHVKEGDAINAEDPLLTLESDKATMEVPAPAGGTVEKILVKVGDKVSEGTPILTLKGGEGAMTQPPSLVAQQEPPPQPQPVAVANATRRRPRRRPRPTGGRAPRRARADFGNVHASPSVRRLARELGST